MLLVCTGKSTKGVPISLLWCGVREDLKLEAAETMFRADSERCPGQVAIRFTCNGKTLESLQTTSAAMDGIEGTVRGF